MAGSRRHASFVESFGRVFKDDSAQGVVEYAIILAFVATVAFLTIRAFGQRTNNMLVPAENAFS